MAGLAWVYIAIYAFHMPLFIYISGHFSRGIDRRNVVEKLLPLVEIYLIFQPIYYFTGPYLDHIEWHRLIAIPDMVMWYVLVLGAYRLVVPRLPEQLPGKLFAGAFVAAIAVGFLPIVGAKFSASRMVCFFPFFLMGFYGLFDRVKWSGLDRSWFSIGMLTLLLAGSMMVGHSDCAPFIHANLWLSAPYSEFGSPEWHVALLRAGIIAAGTLISLVVYRWTPTLLVAVHGPARRIALRAGENVLVIFLYHGLLLRFGAWMGLHWAISLVATLVACILLSQWKFHRFLTNPVSSCLRLCSPAK